jgi:hypothetical protein
VVLAAYEVPVAYSMVAMAAQTPPERRADAMQQFMCYWAAFNNIYVTISERAGRRAQLRRNPDGSIRTREIAQVKIPEVSTVSEREQIDSVFQQFPDDLKRALVEHTSAHFFVHRTPRWRGQPVVQDEGGQRLNGVLNVGYTIDARYPVWTPVDIIEFDAYQQGDRTAERRDALAKQILDVLYTVRNNTFHGGKRADDANDNQVLTEALPLLAMIVKSFVRVEQAA